MKKNRPVEYIIFIIFFIVCIYIINKNQRFKLDELPTHYIFFAFITKLISGLALWYIFTYFYPNKSISDIYKYFEDGKQFAIILKNSPSDYFNILHGDLPKSLQNLDVYHKMKFWVKPNSYGIYNDNQTIIILSSFLNLITHNNLILTTLYTSTISFFATFVLFKTLVSFLEWKKLFFFILFLLPSIALWTSGLLKETIIFCSLTIVIYFGKKLIYKTEIKNIVGCCIGCFALLISKTYLFGFILPSIVCVIIIRILNIHAIKLFFTSSYVILFLLFIGWSLTHNPIVYNYKNKTEIEKRKEYDRINQISYTNNVLGNNYNLLEMLRFKQADYKFEARIAHAKSLIPTKKIDGQLTNFFACLPYGISNGFSRPHIFEINSLLTCYPAIENLLFLLLLALTVIFPRKLTPNQQLLIFAFGTFIVITYVFLGLLVPVLGNLIRYKAPLLPLLYFCLLTLIDKTKTLNFYHQCIRT